MKQINRRTALSTLAQGSALAALAPSLCACRTPAPGSPPGWAALAATVALNVAAVGVATDIQAHPAHRAAYQIAESALTGLIERSNWNPAEFAAIIKGLPVVQLQGPQGMLWATTIVSVYDAITSTIIDVQQAPALESVMRAVRDGIRAGLSAAPSRSIGPAPAMRTLPGSVKRVVI